MDNIYKDAGTELNDQIKAAHKKANNLRSQLETLELVIAELESERAEYRTECKFCNDCSMCIG